MSVRLPLASLNELTTAKLHVVVPAANMDKWYDFKIAVDKGLDLPEKKNKHQQLKKFLYMYTKTALMSYLLWLVCTYQRRSNCNSY